MDAVDRESIERGFVYLYAQAIADQHVGSSRGAKHDRIGCDVLAKQMCAEGAFDVPDPRQVGGKVPARRREQ